MMKILFYENGEMAGSFQAENSEEIFKKINSHYAPRNLDWRKDLSIRIYSLETNRNVRTTYINILRINNRSGKLVDTKGKAKYWRINLEYKKRRVVGNIYDTTDQTIYVLWEFIQKVLGIDLLKSLGEIDFTVSLVKGEKTQKAKLVLFFSNKKNCGKLWKYRELRKAMRKKNLSLVGRGIEGERPREFRYAMGYDFRTNEKDKNVPDGYCLVGSPLPFGRRNERRSANIDLEKKDWSELLGILEKNPKRLRCKTCGLFEGETNRIGQKTKFQKGHIVSHLSRGDVSATNIFSICQYCNTVQSNIYDIDKDTGKKIWRYIPLISKANYKNKIKIFTFLLKHLRRGDVKKIVKENKIS